MEVPQPSKIEVLKKKNETPKPMKKKYSRSKKGKNPSLDKDVYDIRKTKQKYLSQEKEVPELEKKGTRTERKVTNPKKKNGLEDNIYVSRSERVKFTVDEERRL